MGAIFSESVGKVVAIEDGTVPADIKPPLDGLSFESQGAIVTRLAVSEQCAQKFSHTLGALINVYVFGDRMGSAAVSGLILSQKCEGEGGPSKLRDFYLENRIAKKSEPLQITIGAETTVEGFLIGWSLDTADPAAKIFQFDLQLALIPEES